MQVQRVKNKWKVTLKDGLASVNGREFIFAKCQGCVPARCVPALPASLLTVDAVCVAESSSSEPPLAARETKTIACLVCSPVDACPHALVVALLPAVETRIPSSTVNVLFRLAK